MRYTRSIRFMVLLTILFTTATIKAGSINYKQSGRLNPSDYLFGNQKNSGDPFNDFQMVDLGVELEIGSDCGQVNITGTVRAALENMLDAKYFKKLGTTVLGAAPMLLTCYRSPTWCSILKHMRISANLLSMQRLDQCAIVDSYIDSRVEDYQKERQACVHKSIASNNGNLETALDSCGTGKLIDFNLADWNGGGKKTSGPKKLIEDSAAWAGLTSKEAKQGIDLIKAFVGDTVLNSGQITVEYGPAGSPLSPRLHLEGIIEQVERWLCIGLVKRIQKRPSAAFDHQVIRNYDLKTAAPLGTAIEVDRATLKSLASMRGLTKSRACRGLASALAKSAFAKEMNQLEEILSVAAQNPNLPPNRKQEIASKQTTLKGSVDNALDLKNSDNQNLDDMLYRINAAGRLAEKDVAAETARKAAAKHEAQRIEAKFFDCADRVFCMRGK